MRGRIGFSAGEHPGAQAGRRGDRRGEAGELGDEVLRFGQRCRAMRAAGTEVDGQRNVLRLFERAQHTQLVQAGNWLAARGGVPPSGGTAGGRDLDGRRAHRRTPGSRPGRVY